MIGPLDTFQHGFGLPPSRIVGVMQIGHVSGVMLSRITFHARLSDVSNASLDAVFLLPVRTARVGRFHFHTEGGIFKFRNTPLKVSEKRQLSTF